MHVVGSGVEATPTPATLTTPKLIPIVTTAATLDAVELAQTYTKRWATQENIIRDFLLPLGLDTHILQVAKDLALSRAKAILNCSHSESCRTDRVPHRQYQR